MDSSYPFVNSDNAILLDLLCCRYHKLPSEILEIEDKRIAFDFNLSIMLRGIFSQNKEEKINNNNLSKMEYMLGRI